MKVYFEEMATFGWLGALGLAGLACLSTGSVSAQPLLVRVQEERAGVIATLRELVEVESPSSDRAGLDRVAEVLRRRFVELGGVAELHEVSAGSVKLQGAPEKLGKAVVARFSGRGTKRILLLAHMDTVLPLGTLAKRPFRVEGGRAYGPGIADDKGGIAVILHALEVLRKRGFAGYGQVTVLVGADEEISTPGTRGLIGRLAAESDAVLNCEPGGVGAHGLSMSTSGTGAAILTVRGKASHAGIAPQEGRNALVELAFQLLQAKDLSVPGRGLQLNWTLAKAGTTRNAIPDLAVAEADVRAQSVADFQAIERDFVGAVSKGHLIPDTVVEARFERRRPPLEITDGARALYRMAQGVLGEIGIKLEYSEARSSAGSDSAFAGEAGKAPVLEGFGLVGAGYHSLDEEYVDLDSIVPRVYLLARMIEEISAK